jgi:hypothetical protein
MLTDENVHQTPRPSRPFPARPRPRPLPGPSARAAGRFAVHYVEMVVAMAAGMVVLHPVWVLATSGVSATSALRSAEVDALAMATAMSVPMVAWMRLRGHAWAPALEMSGAMYAGFVVLYPALWAGALDDAALMAYGHLLMLVLMLVAMLAHTRSARQGPS